MYYNLSENIIIKKQYLQSFQIYDKYVSFHLVVLCQSFQGHYLGTHPMVAYLPKSDYPFFCFEIVLLRPGAEWQEQ